MEKPDTFGVQKTNSLELYIQKAVEEAALRQNSLEEQKKIVIGYLKATSDALKLLHNTENCVDINESVTHLHNNYKGSCICIVGYNIT